MSVAPAIPMPPDTVTHKGQPYLEGADGQLWPLSGIGAATLLEDELVRRLIGFAIPLGAEIARFKAYSFGDVAAFIGLLEQEYGVTRQRGRKGNMTLMTFDGRMKVEIQVADRITFGPQLQVAKELVNECIRDWTSDPDNPTRPELATLVNFAFEVDKEGNVSPTRIMTLRRVAIAAPKWQEAMRAISDAMRTTGSKSYMRFYQRADLAGDWQAVRLDFAAAELTEAAIDAPSARRELEAAQAEIARLRQQLTALGGETTPPCDTEVAP